MAKSERKKTQSVPVRIVGSRQARAGLVNRTLERAVISIGEDIWRVGAHHGRSVDDGYIVVRTGSIIRCECRVSSRRGRWCAHLIAVWKSIRDEAYSKVRPWVREHVTVSISPSLIEALFNSAWTKLPGDTNTDTVLLADKGYLGSGERRG